MWNPFKSTAAVSDKTQPRDGYKENEHGHLVPVGQIKTDKLKEDELVQAVAKELTALSDAVHGAKSAVMGFIDKYYDGEEHSEDYRTFYSFDGRYKLIVSTYKHRIFNDKLRQAWLLMSECIDRWSDSESEHGAMLKALAIQRVDFQHMTAHEKNQILELQKIPPPDNEPDWDKALSLLGRAVEVVRTKKRVNLYERDEVTRQYNLVQVNFYRVNVEGDVKQGSS
jgi:hypothetical protein